MSAKIHTVRPAQPSDRAAIGLLYPKAFPDEDLLPLIARLWEDPSQPLMLVAEADNQVVGHIALSECQVNGSHERLALLGPLAVSPDWQLKGIGSTLIGAARERLASDGFAILLVLGDPGYYSRLGFRPEPDIAPPYALPDDWRGAWQSQRLGAAESLAGTVCVPDCWRDPTLWGP